MRVVQRLRRAQGIRGIASLAVRSGAALGDRRARYRERVDLHAKLAQSEHFILNERV
jgi:hypothetical protein